MTPFESERDQNVRVDSHERSYLFKVCNADEDESVGRNIVISKKKGPVSTIRVRMSREDAHAGKKLVVDGSAI